MTFNNGVKVTYVGHATSIITTPGGKRILIDPWVTGNPSVPQELASPAKLGAIDAVLITHLHNDHVGDVIEVLALNPQAAVVCVPEVHNWLKSQGAAGNITEMNIGGCVRVGDVDASISMTMALHTNSFEGADGTLFHAGPPIGFAIEVDGGFTIYASGDTGVFGDMALIRDIYSPSLAILPIGDHYTMGPRLAAYAAKLLGVKYVVPVHYGTFPLLHGTPQQLVQHLGDSNDIQVLALQPGASAE
jgi:L-ascorbate metabolism protein UlaG (beta-lactamase superfamily)